VSEQGGGFEAQLFGTVGLGFSAEAFKQSEIGKYLYGKADLEREGLIAELIACDPDDRKENTRIRFDLACLDCWRAWMDDAITAGLAAQQQLLELENNPIGE
jgi:hypothetical protein